MAYHITDTGYVEPEYYKNTGYIERKCITTNLHTRPRDHETSVTN